MADQFIGLFLKNDYTETKKGLDGLIDVVAQTPRRYQFIKKVK